MNTADGGLPSGEQQCTVQCTLYSTKSRNLYEHVLVLQQLILYLPYTNLYEAISKGPLLASNFGLGQCEPKIASSRLIAS